MKVFLLLTILARSGSLNIIAREIRSYQAAYYLGGIYIKKSGMRKLVLVLFWREWFWVK